MAGWAARRGGRPIAAGACCGFVAGASIELSGFAALAVPAALPLLRGGEAGLAAGAVGVATAMGSRRAWPVAPRTPAEIHPMLTPIDGEPAPDGEGLIIVVNSNAGPALRPDFTDTLSEALPHARIVELDPDDNQDLGDVLRDVVGDARLLGIAGGDGSVNTAAAVAHQASKPLVVFPGGTLNHLARDLGIGGIQDAIDAVRDGHLVAVDVGMIDGRPFLNTASFGSYSNLVDARERFEHHIGKWPALLVALVHVLRHAEPVHVRIDGVERRLWMIFVGNCRYHPAGFAPAWRKRLDDGVLDVRLVGAERPAARVRLLAAVLTGRLGRTRVHEAFTAHTVEVQSLDGPLRLARDGETFEGSASFVITKHDTPLAVYVPLPGD
jgi:undecaprenyl-diphosphatase